MLDKGLVVYLYESVACVVLQETRVTGSILAIPNISTAKNAPLKDIHQKKKTLPTVQTV